MARLLGRQSWGKVDPDSLPDCVVCYLDSTISLPLITAYLVAPLEERQSGFTNGARRCSKTFGRNMRHGKVEKIAHRTDVRKKLRASLPKGIFRWAEVGIVPRARCAICRAMSVKFRAGP